MSLVAVCNCLH